MNELSQIEDIFFDALKMGSSEERVAFLEKACADDRELRRRVEKMLQAQDRTNDFLEKPPLAADDEGLIEHSGTTIGPYKLLEQIGEGGFGVVFLSEQTAPVRRKVALKILKPGMDTRQIVARFEAERQALAIMDHQNIAKVFDGGATPSGRPYFVMELVKGVPITEFCDQNQLTPRQRLDLFIPVCHAVQHAHQKGIIHRDLKPSNVLVSRHDTTPIVKVIDFGVAKALGQELTDKTLFTGIAQMIGTPLYMSPEQAGMSDLDIDTRSDIYSLGILLYELLTGTTPFDKERFKIIGYDEMRRIIREEEPPKPSTRISTLGLAGTTVCANRNSDPRRLRLLLRGELDWIVMKCLEKDRARRYETANGLAMDLQRYLTDEPVLACPPSAVYRLKKFVRRNKGAVLAVSLVTIVLLGGIIGTAFGLVRAEQRAEGERRATDTAEKRLAQIAKGNDILTSIFADLDIRRIKEGTEPLEAVLSQRLVQAAAQLEGEAIGDPLLVAELQDRLGLTLLNLGYPQEAIGLCVKARDTRILYQGADHIDTLRTMSYLATGYKDTGKLELALPLFEHTLRLITAKLGSDHTDTLSVMCNLALGYQAAGKLNLALPLLEDTLKLRKAKLGADHPDTLTSMNNLASGYYVGGKLELALPLLEDTLKLRKANLGTDHPDTLTSMHNLAAGYRTAGKLDFALPLLEDTLKLRKAKLGADHPDTLTSMNNLADCYQAAGKLHLAMPLYEHSLRLRKAKLGLDHADTLMSMHNLAMGYHVAKKLDLALPLYEDALKLQQEKLGPDHPDTLMTMNNLAVCYKAAGKLDLALPLYEENLKLTKAKQGPDHPETITGTNNLAVGYKAAGKLDLALAQLQEAAAGVENRRFQHEHAEQIVNNLISCHELLKQFDQAEPWRRKWLAVVKERSGDDTVASAGALAALGSNLLQQEKWTDAEAVLRECLAIREKRQPDAWTTFNTVSILGGALLGQKKYADAEPLLVRGYEGMKNREAKIPLQGRRYVTSALERLVQLYDAWGKPDEAAKWRRELEKAQMKE